MNLAFTKHRSIQGAAHEILPLVLFATLLLSACESSAPVEAAAAGADWPAYLGHPSSNQYSTLDQINRKNVAQLEVAWTYDTGDTGNYQVNNLIVDGILYTATPHSRVIALDGATGQHLWTFDPSTVDDSLADGDQRGLMYWKDGDQGRILTSKGARLFALDAITGELIPTFGDGGSIHLGDGMDLPYRPNVSLNTPGHIFEDLLIVGGNVGESVPGSIRAFDLRSGKRAWIFHTLPRPGEFGSETWPETYLEKTGGASDWSGLAIDKARGIVYISTETAGPDFYGEDRYGENLFANSLVALDARTGKRLWHHQLVHHDLWDMDLPTPPTLLTVTHEGKQRDIVAQGTKMGLLFVFDRESGEPLWSIEERSAPTSQLADVRTWPTQPFPTRPPPLTRQKYTADDYSNISPRAALMTEEVLKLSGNYGSYPPPSLEQSIIFPGYDGGMEWGGSAADPDGILYVNVNEIPWFYQLVPTRNSDGNLLPFGETLYRIQCAACHGLNREGNPGGGFPALDQLATRWEREALGQFITQGGGRMPAFDHLSEVQRKAIVDFLYGEQTDPDPAYANKEIQPYVFRGFQRWQDDEGYPAIKPPWGALNAVDLNTGTLKWQVPLGEYKELSARGIPVTGTENYGGPVVTAGGLIFIGASSDEMFRAFDKDTGAILWEHELPFDGHATPSTYLANGRQYVVISAGGSKMKPVHGGELVAFALPE
ncbi:MAG: pyrroloquinoline quinone-dependent dehydrogenase [Gammaproteobacteria bacterium]|nr:pyrroloquinoline quinone-dependent dehydrogenase [Gammaproteobacteria bacterium]MDH5302913.1 pyrroloquinoline quinone-dependent dehydrogenase [Gammaproteobacteria bacterium]